MSRVLCAKFFTLTKDRSDFTGFSIETEESTIAIGMETTKSCCESFDFYVCNSDGACFSCGESLSPLTGQTLLSVNTKFINEEEAEEVEMVSQATRLTLRREIMEHAKTKCVHYTHFTNRCMAHPESLYGGIAAACTTMKFSKCEVRILGWKLAEEADWYCHEWYKSVDGKIIEQVYL